MPQTSDAPPAPAQSFYRPELDGLRFFAFFSVFLSHTVLQAGDGEQHHRLPGAVAMAIRTLRISGAFGVDLFFVLSGYLITELLLRERRNRSRVDIKAFYIRRLLRIGPLYFTFLAIAYALSFFWPGEAMTWKHLLGFALVCGNWVCIMHPVATVAAPLWSVSVEEQFYLLWPRVMRDAPTQRLVKIAVGLVVLGITVRAGLGIAGIGGEWVTKNSFTRIDGLAAGIILAATLDGRLPQLDAETRGRILAASLATLLVVAFGINVLKGPALALHQTLGWSIGALGCAGIVIALLGADSPIARFLGSPPVVYLGRLSYGLYVFHELGLLFAKAMLPRDNRSAWTWIAQAGLGFVLTMALAAASYRWLEGPFLRLKERYFTRVRSRPSILPGEMPIEKPSFVAEKA
jgi:peptidoglycan/LPS O-acetylase OafA/YrhL